MAGKGNPKTGGRKKGTGNKLGLTAKENIQNVFDGLGGYEAMQVWAKQNQTEFYRGVYPRILPTEVKGPGENGEHKLDHRVEMVIVDPKG